MEKKCLANAEHQISTVIGRRRMLQWRLALYESQVTCFTDDIENLECQPQSQYDLCHIFQLSCSFFKEGS